MCGLLGFDLKKSNLAREQRAIMAAILALGNDHRGGDSWGYYNFFKLEHGLGDLADHAIEFFSHPIVMAHTRKATQGSVTKENAHPFEIGNIIGAHNGVISNHHPLNHKYKRDCTVDSQHIFHHLNEGKSLDDIRGYGVIEWVEKNVESKRVYLCKLASGDLSIFGIGKDEKNVRGIIWSSDDDHIKAAAQAAKINGFFFKVEPNVVYYVEDGKLFIDHSRKLEINRDTSKTWESFETHHYSGYGGYPHSKSGDIADSPDANTKIAQDDELDAIIARFRSEEDKRVSEDETTKEDVAAKTETEESSDNGPITVATEQPINSTSDKEPETAKV